MANDHIPCLLNSRLLNASLRETSKRHAAAASVGLLVAASGNLGLAEIMVVRTVGPYTSVGTPSTSFDVLFDLVTDATQLVSISAGSVVTGEGGYFDISAIFANDSTQSIHFESFWGTLNLSSIPTIQFTPFTLPEDVKGLRFSANQQYANTPNGTPSISLPASTTLTFAAVPEPSTGLLLVFGMVLLVACRGRIFGAVRHAAS